MNKAKRLSELIGVPVEVVERDIDKGMWDILIELNYKNWFTQFSCEGHLGRGGNSAPDAWQGYLVFREPYKFPNYPVRYTKTNKRHDTYYWDGKGEENRQAFLKMLLEWAMLLPFREIKKVKWYTLSAKLKNRPNSDYKVLAHTTDYEEIKIILAGADMDKYTEIRLLENEV